MRKDLVIFRCKGCIENLKKHNPYVDKAGNTIPLDRIEVIEVEKDFCEYAELNLISEPQLQAPINLEGYPDRPWRVVVWNSIYDREQGVSEIFGWYETFEDARAAIEKDSLSKYWAAYEIQLDNEEESIVVYNYANCRPLADEFIKVTAGQSRKLSAVRPLKRYKVYVHFEGCIGYGVLAGNEEEAKEKALSLYEDEESEYIIDKLIHKVCDCESPKTGSDSDSSCIPPIKTKFNRKLTSDEFNGLNKIASSTKMDCWFYIMEEVGRDIIWDVKNNKILSIEDGVSRLIEGMIDPITKYGLTENEIKAVEELFKQINDTEEG